MNLSRFLLPMIALGGCTGCVLFDRFPPQTAPLKPAEIQALGQRLDGEGVARWMEANRRIASALAKRHPNPWFRLSEADFRRQVAALDQDLPTLSERQVLLRWKLIFAAVGDEHTQIQETSTRLEGWPLRIRVLKDGVFISETSRDQKELFGARILRIADLSAEDYLRALGAFVGAATPAGRTSLLEDAFPYGWLWLKETGRLPSRAMPALDVQNFVRRMAAETSQAPQARMVLDLRGNGGGRSHHARPLLAWMQTQPRFARPGGTLVLTDHAVFSAALDAAMALKRRGALIVGQESGQAMNYHAYLRYTRLPGLNTAFQCSYAATLNEPKDPSAWHASLPVDVPVEPVPDDILGLTDTTLDRALALSFPPAP